MKDFEVILTHMMYGGGLKKVSDKLEIPKSTIYDILIKEKNRGGYVWDEHKECGIAPYLEQNKYGIIDSILTVKNINLDKYRKIIVLPDIHYPLNIPLGGIEDFMRDYKPDIIIYLGDLLDLDYLSKYSKENKLIVRDRLKVEYDYVISMIEKHREISKAGTVYYIEGNHEHRVKKFLEVFPQGSGFIEIPIAMDFKSRDINWVEMNLILQIGDLSFAHGLYYNMYHAKKHVDIYHRNLLYGHTHAIQSHSGFHVYDTDRPYIAKSIGCLCSLNPEYRKNWPNQWVNSFDIVEIEENGNYNDSIIIVNSDGSFRVVGTSKYYRC